MKPNKLFILIAVASLSYFAKAQNAVEPIKKVEVGKNREFVVNGKPFFPIMSWAQPAKNYKPLQQMGMNTACGDVDPAAAKESGIYAVTQGNLIAKTPNDMILGMIFDDEPDMPTGRGEAAKPRQTPEQVAEKVKGTRAENPGRLLFMTWTGNFTKEESTYPAEFREKIYPEYAKNADVMGFDIYPIYGSGYASHLNWVGSGVKQICSLAGHRPVYTWIETSKGSKWMTYEKQPDVLPIHTRNEVWQAIINGATAIGYFTHAWRPEFKEFAPTPEMQKELARLNAQITRLAPAILASPAKEKIEMKLGDNLACSFKATNYKGSLYIFSENNDLGPGAEKAKQFDPITPRSAKAVFTIANLKAGTIIEVVDENRTITADKGSFADEFAPLAEHIFKLK
jgi:hypothetical protein